MLRIYNEGEALADERTYWKVEDIASLVYEGGSYVVIEGELWTVCEGTEVCK